MFQFLVPYSCLVTLIVMQMSLFMFCVEVDISTDLLSSGFTSYKIQDLQYGRTYIFSIRPLYGEVEGPVTTITKRICKALSLQISLAFYIFKC